MKNIFYILIAAFSLILHAKCVGQNNIVYGAGISYTNGVPTFVPPSKSARVAIDTVTSKWYEYATPGGWRWSGDRVTDISGCAAPAYTPGKAQSRLVLNNCTFAQNGHGPELYKYTGSAWLCLNCSTGGGVYTGGEGIVVDSPTIRIDTLDRVTFATSPTLPGGVGTVRWNDTDGTAEIGLKGGNVTLQLGQEQTTIVKHADNSGLTNGSVVYVVGSDGANKTVRYAKADAESTSANTFGVMTESATGGAKAFCTTFGLVRDLNTSALTEGAMVWVSAATAGAMTTTRPTAPNHAVQVGFCIRSHATQGVIFVSVQNGYELGELHDVAISSPTTGQALLYDTNKWVNSALPSPSLTIDNLTDVAITSPSNNQILQYNTAGSQWVNATLSAITGSGTANTLAKFTASGVIGNSQIVDNGTVAYLNGFLGINTSSQQSVSTKFEVNSKGRFWNGIELGQYGTVTIDANGDYRKLASGSDGFGFYNSLSYAPTGGSYAWATVQTTLAESSGSASVSVLRIRPVINQSGTTNATTIGLDVNAIETSVLGPYYAALFRSGQVSVGNATPNTAAKLEITSTTQGVLFPRMTATQRDAIAAPPDGLVVYNTTAAKLQVRAASAWVDLH